MGRQWPEWCGHAMSVADPEREWDDSTRVCVKCQEPWPCASIQARYSQQAQEPAQLGAGAEAQEVSGVARACAELIRVKGSGWRPQYRPCARKAAVERNGKWYCKQHDPEAVAARDAAKRAKWDEEWKLKEEANALAAAEGVRLGVKYAWPAGLPAGYVALHYEQLRMLMRIQPCPLNPPKEVSRG